MDKKEIEDRIIKILKEKGDISKTEIGVLAGISKYILDPVLEDMKKENSIEIKENGKRKHIHLIEVKSGN